MNENKFLAFLHADSPFQSISSTSLCLPSEHSLYQNNYLSDFICHCKCLFQTFSLLFLQAALNLCSQCSSAVIVSYCAETTSIFSICACAISDFFFPTLADRPGYLKLNPVVSTQHVYDVNGWHVNTNCELTSFSVT